MKVKKLLTLLIATSMLAGCGTKTASSSSNVASSDNGSSAINSGSDAPASTSTPNSSSSVAPVVLASISVTAPTKTTYLTTDTQLDLAGMVVTAKFSDEHEEVVTEGYTIGNVDLTTPGVKTVTVTYQGKTATFQITVEKYIPTAWDADLIAKFKAYLCDYELPFFYSGNYGFGELAWDENADYGILYAEGDATVPAAAADADSPLKPVADFLAEDGFTTNTEPDVAKEVYHYILEKPVSFEGSIHYIQVRMALCDAEGYFAEAGTFYFEISDAYYYSYADSGIEADVKEAFGFTEDIPDLPAGVRFLKREKQLIARMAQSYGFAEFTAYNCDSKATQAYLAALRNANWIVKQSSREGLAYDCYSPAGEIRMGLAYSSKAKEFLVRIDLPASLPDYVKYVAQLVGVPANGQAFVYDSENEAYFYDFEETLSDGKTLEDLADKYSNLFKNDTEGGFVQKGERASGSSTYQGQAMTYVKDAFVSETLGGSVSVFAFQVGTETGVEISVEEYIPVPSQFLPAAELLGLTEDQLNTEGDGVYEPVTAFAHFQYAASVSYADALAEKLAILDNDTTLNFRALYEVEDVTMNNGAAGKHVEYANDSVLLEIFAWTVTGSYTVVQVSFSDYSPAPESAWMDAILAALAPNYKLSWSGSEYTLGREVTLPEGQTLQEAAEGIAYALLDDESLGLDILLENFADEGEAKVILYSPDNEGSLEILFSTYYGENTIVLFITGRVFDKNIDVVVNALGALTGVNLEEFEAGIYTAIGRFGMASTYSLAQYGKALLTYYVAADLMACEALGFVLAQQGMTQDGAYGGIFVNEEGYEVDIFLLGDADRNYNNYYRVVVYEPAE